ncbi:hypothetical protein M378DRAFT_16615, partial [Amanita muscaria Koide BX008]
MASRTATHAAHQPPARRRCRGATSQPQETEGEEINLSGIDDVDEDNVDSSSQVPSNAATRCSTPSVQPIEPRAKGNSSEAKDLRHFFSLEDIK